MGRALVVVWVAGLVAGLLLRTSAGHHGLLAALVVVAVNAAAGGYAFWTWRRLARSADAELDTIALFAGRRSDETTVEAVQRALQERGAP
jgi:hypothetical protein